MGSEPVPERANIRQVAARAGVSHMTVSRVLNNGPNIRPDTREKVLAAIAELNYRPNSAARALATQRHQRIGVLMERSFAHGPTNTLRGVELAAGEVNYSVTSVTLRPDDAASPRDGIERLRAQGVDGICVIAPRSTSLSVLRQLDVRVPVVVIKSDADPNFITVSVDQKMGTDLLVDHLAEHGHRDVLHVSGPLDWLDAKARERAFRARAKAWKMKERPIVVGDWSADFAYDYVRGLARRPDYTAIFAANDETALGLMHGFAERGISVPEEISIVGFDDLPLAGHFLPPLTTIRQDFLGAGAKALEIVIAAAEGKDVPRRTKLPIEFIRRSSVSTPRSEP